MTNLTYENFGHLVSNPTVKKKASKRPSICSANYKLQGNKTSPITLTNSDNTIEQAERTNEKGFSTRFWASILRLSVALEKAIVNPHQWWMVYK